MQNYRYSKKTKLFLSLIPETLGRGGWLGTANVWAPYHVYIAPFAPSCPLPPFCSGADGHGSSCPCSQDSSLCVFGSCRLTPQLGLPPATHVRLQAEPAQWFLTLEKNTQMKRPGTNPGFILESRYWYATWQQTKPNAPNCVMPTILFTLCHLLKRSRLRWRMDELSRYFSLI